MSPTEQMRELVGHIYKWVDLTDAERLRHYGTEGIVLVIDALCAIAISANNRTINDDKLRHEMSIRP